MVKYSWTKSAIECYESGSLCANCGIFSVIGKQCRMKETIKTLIKKIGKPPKAEQDTIKRQGEVLMLDKDLNIEYPNFLASTIDALKKGYSSYGQLENVTGIKKSTLSVYINDIFKRFADAKLVNPNTEQSRRIALADFIQTRLVNPEYKEKYIPEKKEQSPYELAVQKSNIIVKNEPEEILINAQLTERESEVMSLLLEGLSQKEVANRLTLSITTVKAHINSIYQKKNYHSLNELVASELKKENQMLQEKIKQLEKSPKIIDFSVLKKNIKNEIEKLTNKLQLLEEFEKEFKSVSEVLS